MQKPNAEASQENLWTRWRYRKTDKNEMALGLACSYREKDLSDTTKEALFKTADGMRK